MFFIRHSVCGPSQHTNLINHAVYILTVITQAVARMRERSVIHTKLEQLIQVWPYETAKHQPNVLSG